MMKRDYHGSRTYEVSETANRREGVTLAWILGLAKGKLFEMLRWASRPTSSRTLLEDGKPLFTKLGRSDSNHTRVRPTDCPFPTQATHGNNNWRVLP